MRNALLVQAVVQALVGRCQCRPHAGEAVGIATWREGVHVGQRPFELPSSMAAVERQAPDAPHDSVDPLYPYGWGLEY